MKHQHRLLVGALDGSKPHGGPHQGLGDGFGIREPNRCDVLHESLLFMKGDYGEYNAAAFKQELPYHELKVNWADLLPRDGNMDSEKSMRLEFVYCLNVVQITVT